MSNEKISNWGASGNVANGELESKTEDKKIREKTKKMHNDTKKTR